MSNTSQKYTEIILKDLPKLSLNTWYASSHWSKRKKIKDKYFWLIKSQFNSVFPKNKEYVVEYVFFYKNRPLDASNTIAQIKLIEDVIFEDDKWDVVRKITTSSHKDKKDYVKIKIHQQ